MAHKWPFSHDGSQQTTFNSVTFMGPGTVAPAGFSSTVTPGVIGTTMAAPPAFSTMTAPPAFSTMTAPPAFSTMPAPRSSLVTGCTFSGNTQFGDQNAMGIMQPSGQEQQKEEIYELDEDWQKDIQIRKGHPPVDIDVDNTYKMSEEPRGRALIINNVDFGNNTKLKKRDGSDCDAANLESIFDQIHFDVKVARDKDLEGMKKEIRYLQKHNHSNCDALVVVILSHGNEDGVCATDGQVLPISEIINSFNDKNCPQLKGKPKLFFMMFCRGNDEIKYREMQRDSDDDACSDMLIAYSTKEGRVSYRNGKRGSIYGQFLVKSLEANAASKDIVEILEDVTRKMTRKKINSVYGQESEFKQIGFDKKLYFRPFN